MEGLILLWMTLLGACVGSFTNVVAWWVIAPPGIGGLPRQPLPQMRPCHPLA